MVKDRKKFCLIQRPVIRLIIVYWDQFDFDTIHFSLIAVLNLFKIIKLFLLFKELWRLLEHLQAVILLSRRETENMIPWM